ncbi:hypothetical protein GCM10025864_03730 [Luteimicrobium album]|uniref:Uncharacterized protein n=1 Tax=Luteimicrobium album TaxID=1054550 RepID=A0ABQ6HVS4_9MICO|nr:hypothetical protein GCM10025864_03730 [Luteimicrobium album]
MRREDLVPVVRDPAGGPAVAAPAREAHRVGERRTEERPGRGGAPVHEEPASVVVGQPEPPDVDGLGVVGADHPAEAQVGAEPAKRAQARGEAVDLLVAVERLLATADPCAPGGVEAVGEVGDGLVEARGDVREVPRVARDELGIGLGGEVMGEGEQVRGGVSHVSASARGPRPDGPRPAILRRRRGLAARPLCVIR